MSDIETAIRELIESVAESTEENTELESKLDDYENRIDVLEENTFSEDSVLSVVEQALKSMPDDEGARCSLGDAFTDAVRKVLTDDVTVEEMTNMLGNVFAPSIEAIVETGDQLAPVGPTRPSPRPSQQGPTHAFSIELGEGAEWATIHTDADGIHIRALRSTSPARDTAWHLSWAQLHELVLDTGNLNKHPGASVGNDPQGYVSVSARR